MNWYEAAGPDEIRDRLESLLYTYNFSVTDYKDEWDDKENQTKVASYQKLPSQGYEIAEGLWGEYSEELF